MRKTSPSLASDISTLPGTRSDTIHGINTASLALDNHTKVRAQHERNEITKLSLDLFQQRSIRLYCCLDSQKRGNAAKLQAGGTAENARFFFTHASGARRHFFFSLADVCEETTFSVRALLRLNTLVFVVIATSAQLPRKRLFR